MSGVFCLVVAWNLVHNGSSCLRPNLDNIKYIKTIHKRKNTTKRKTAKTDKHLKESLGSLVPFSFGSPSVSFFVEKRVLNNFFLKDAKWCGGKKWLSRDWKNLTPKNPGHITDNSEVYFWFGANLRLKKWSLQVNVKIDTIDETKSSFLVSFFFFFF